MHAVLEYVDLEGNVHQIKREDLFPRIERVRDTKRALKASMVGRDTLIDIIFYSLLLRANPLTWGPPGTGKTLCMRRLVGACTGMRSFSIGLSAETTENKLFGDPDGKRYREHGEIHHRVEGSILDAHIAHLGEVLNAGPQLLESLHDVILEREFHRGTQHIPRLPLITTLGDTNVDPYAAIAETPSLEPFIDRFRFILKVDKIRDVEARLRMLSLRKSGATMAPLPPIDLEDIIIISGVIKQMDLAEDSVIEQAFEELDRTLEGATGLVLTDRTWTGIHELIELSALLHGRTQATLDDLLLTKLGFVRRAQDADAFDEAFAKVVKGKWMQSEVRERLRAEAQMLERIQKAIPTEEEILARHADGFMILLRRLNAAQGRLESMTFQSPAHRDQRQQLLADIEVHRSMLFGKANASASPEDLAAADALLAQGANPEDPDSAKES